MKIGAITFLAAALGLGAPATAAPAIVPAPGVHPHDVVVGSVLDLSGPLAAEGIAIRNGLTMAFDEINKDGGVNGRKIRLIARDSAYDPDKARKATRALLEHGIFAMIGSNGTPPVSASIGLVLDAGVLHLFPFVPAHTGYEALRRLSFALDLPVTAQIRLGLKTLLDERGPLHVGGLYRDDAYGRAALKGVRQELARRGLPLIKTAKYTAGTTNLSRELTALRDAGVELVVLGAVPQESLRALAQAHRARWFPVFLCPTACYVPETATLGGRTAEGLYSVATTPIPYPDTRNPKLRAWVQRYERRFRAVASAQALRAYLDGYLFAAALRHSGPHPTPLHFARELEAMPAWHGPDLGGIAVDYTAEDHIGLHGGYLAEIVRGRWQLMSQPLSIPAE